ncbi:hypothetical protein ACFUJR_25845 [Streptomyces sp. NPDC057271]|uniref:hypothetical protein n=1 Tax=unclassified Streptomyces TaxID=2593676 RepID=UPI003630B92F
MYVVRTVLLVAGWWCLASVTVAALYAVVRRGYRRKQRRLLAARTRTTVRLSGGPGELSVMRRHRVHRRHTLG